MAKKKKKNAAEKRRERDEQRGKRIAAAQENKVQKEKDRQEQKTKAAYVPIRIPEIDRTPAAQIKEIVPDAPITIVVQALSPLHLGAGRADIHVDADIVQDDVGLPYFPAKRLKGLLYESGLEVTEMAEASGLTLFDRAALDVLFQRGRTGDVQLVLRNLYMEHYEELHADFQYLAAKYPSVFRAADILDTYASLRWQTMIERETGVAKATSLHNMRVIEKGMLFSGEMQVIGADMAHLKMLALAARNLSQSGGKRTRGFGRIGCTLRQGHKDILVPLVAHALTGKGGKYECRR